MGKAPRATDALQNTRKRPGIKKATLPHPVIQNNTGIRVGIPPLSCTSSIVVPVTGNLTNGKPLLHEESSSNDKIILFDASVFTPACRPGIPVFRDNHGPASKPEPLRQRRLSQTKKDREKLFPKVPSYLSFLPGASPVSSPSVSHSMVMGTNFSFLICSWFSS